MAVGTSESSVRGRRPRDGRFRVEHGVLLLGLLTVAWVLLTRVTWIPSPEVPPGTARQYFSEQHLEAVRDHASAMRGLGLVSLGLSIALLVLAVSSARVRTAVRRLPGPWWVSVVVAGAALLLASRLLTLPLGYLQWRRRVDLGVAVDAPALWLRDVLTTWATSTVVVLLVVVVLVGTRRRWQRAWTAVSGLLLAAGVVLGSYVHPVFIAPLSHSFTPLPSGELRAATEDLATVQGLVIADVVVADASRRGTAMNAWISGFGATRQVVLYDTLVEEAPTEVALSVVAHELAHAQHGHVLTGTLLGAGGVMAGVGLLGICWPPARGRNRSGAPTGAAAGRRGDPWQGVLLVAVFALAMQASVPLQSALSRTMEREADRTAVETTADPDAFVALQVILAERAFSDPDPPRWSQWWWGTHPTTVERIAPLVPQGR